MLPHASRLVSLLRRASIGSAVVGASLLLGLSLFGCKRSEPPPDLLKTQREAMERAKDVGKTMQKSVDEQGKKADEEGR
ncbi:MAG: hypothetical protein ACR2GP_05975 [Burkholderiaceae bacterium]